MIDVSPQIIVITMFCLIVLLAILGTPVVFALGGAAVLSIILFWGLHALSVTVTSAYAVMAFYMLTCIPLFIFMALVLEKSGVAEDLFDSIRLWFAGMPGGVAMGVVVMSCIIAAMSGISGTGMAIMGVLALPYMLRRGYDKTMAMGPIMAGAALAFLIPPSAIAIIYGALVRVSIGKLFLGGIIPGFILATLYMIYIGVRSYFKPELAPPLPPEERVSFKKKIISLKSVILPAFIIMGCLGTIFMGIASPTEAAAVGATGAIISAAIYRRLNWALIKHATYETFRITGMVMWILIGAFTFKAVFVGAGGPGMVSDIISGLGLTPFQTIIMMQVTYVFLGCFLDDLTIMMVSFPVFIPLVSGFGFDLVWFGVLFAVNMQIAYLTPPLGFCLFYMKGVAPPGVTMTDIYKAIIPFIPLQIIGLVIVLLNPQLVLWLPNMVFG